MSETSILWIIGMQSTVTFAVIGLLARGLIKHTDSCRHWQEKFLVEHGEILGKLEIVLKHVKVDDHDGLG